MTVTPALMIQATGSNAGKSTLVAGLARVLVRRGLKVAPFKPQNMSNNAAVAVDGGEIGRAQAVQARAARLPPSVHMNPVLLKPQTDTGAQIIVQGERWGELGAGNYLYKKPALLPFVLDSFARLARDADIVLVEGAGSPAETNLRAGDIANMGFAAAANVPVVLAGDIDRGGVIASLAGTHLVLEDDERARIHGFIINKFRGDARLFDQGLREITRHTGWPSLGVVPWLPQAAWLPAEDAVDLDRARSSSATRIIAVPMLARIANFDDLDPLGMEPGVKLVFVPPGQPIPGNADVVIIPGSKSTLGDLAFLRAQGWDIDIAAHVRRGGHLLGLCGGYQMLGKTIADPDGLDGPAGRVDGLGLLDIATLMQGDKSTTLVSGIHCTSGAPVQGYEIHLGRSDGADCARPVLTIDGRPDGAISRDGKVQGTYVHGLFTGDAFRKAWLAQLGIASTLAYDSQIETALDALADHLEAHLDIEQILKIARLRHSTSASAA
ncbi:MULTISPECIES: cobyric acid synthase [Rhodopseudomonas]|uniref:Cobyric acid synthase n=1 Tax=Rhodopseudomonas palustris TaxID=1076 RepID=A0A0D7E5L1_RHOPL|nr:MULTISPECIES: cobyric acid synthase [Rhodopseudomonas]KIZ36169.1 cobalamin biosynthesis protein CobQ [Rhodopseudomonas palustris]MDF3812154.1 cobyric acid synthase [Rhodopseudomonas sp. BAL398]WOK16544.1 cobyric acid synthase [Rhodopseudomonas sp. BAL398]